MSDIEKKKQALREKVADQEKRHDDLLASRKDKGEALDGAMRSKLEQLEKDMAESTKEMAELRNQEKDERVMDSIKTMREGFGKPADKPEALEDRTISTTQRVDTEELRNSHPAFRDWNGGIGEFLGSVCQRETTGTVDARLGRYFESRAPTQFGELIDSDGGFLVPPQFAAGLLQRTYSIGQVMSLCSQQPMTGNKLVLNGVDETSRATGSRFGGVQAYWLAESATITASKGKFHQVTLEPEILAALTYVSESLLQDTTALTAFINRTFPEEMSFMIEDAIIEGDGAGKPTGIKNHAAMLSITKETGQALKTIVPENVIKMRARLWARSRAKSVWLTNQDIEPQLHTMSLAVGTGGVPVYLPAGGLAGSNFDTLYGRPVIPVEYAETLGTVGDISLVDLSQYVLGQRAGVQTATSIHVNFTKIETAFRFHLRIDGQPLWKAALTPFKGTLTQSPFVNLATRA